jgi:predicted short-subunit dehydrogenase-like oxidoreductase (DUF2520 family)
MIKDITVIGAGRLGFHLGKALYSQGRNIRQVFSRGKQKAERLASATDSQAISELTSVDGASDLYIIAVSDDAIPAVAEALSRRISNDKIVVHTSGASPSTVLTKYFLRGGVFYPLQTFSENKVPDFKKIPIGVYSTEPAVEQQLFHLAAELTNQPWRMDDQQRATLHLAAVFVNNFSNYLFTVGHELATQHGLPFDLLIPLIEETVEKIKSYPPIDMQTGPARRNDQATLQRHLTQLEGQAGYQRVYQLLSAQIAELYQKK